VRNAARHGCDGLNPEIRIEPCQPPAQQEAAAAQSVAAPAAPAADGRQPSGGPSAGHAWVRVHDNGPGIPAEYREEIFLPGRRLPNAHESGTGMGLAIVRKIVEFYGGAVLVDRACRQGAAILLSLPIETAVTSPRIAS
jgi:signal transduction histidine kinase